jgi:hypothetical protein
VFHLFSVQLVLNFYYSNRFLPFLTCMQTLWFSLGEWDRDLQLDLFKKVLPGQGFVCYWAGVDNLWRITDCTLAHYDTPTWSNVACVNARIPEAKPLLDKMEKIFAETLAKDITF